MAKSQKLTIVMANEFFHPFAQGGSEWSTFYLAKSLYLQGYKVIILTPNYGSQSKQIWENLIIERFPIGKKISQADQVVTPFWHTNPWWIFKSTLGLIRMANKYHPQIIHIQGKYFLPAAIITKMITHIPVIATARDYQIICNLGLCLWKKSHRCKIAEFFSDELPRYCRKYHKNSHALNLTKTVITATLGRIVSIFLRLAAKNVDSLVCISAHQTKIYSANGFKKLNTIYNSTTFPKGNKTQRHNLLFVGRLTPGKGAHLLVPILNKVRKHFPKIGIQIIGNGFLLPHIKQQIRHYQAEKYVEIISQANHNQVQSAYQKAKIVIIPSLWPEPFGRVALEAIAAGTPIITSNKGALPEITQNRYGISVAPTINELANALVKMLVTPQKYSMRIKHDRLQLRERFEKNPVKSYRSLYASIIS